MITLSIFFLSIARCFIIIFQRGKFDLYYATAESFFFFPLDHMAGKQFYKNGYVKTPNSARDNCESANFSVARSSRFTK